MKKLLTFLCIIAYSSFYAQSNKDIAAVYINRSEAKAGNLEWEQAFTDFQKALSFMDTITSPRVAKLGASIAFERDDLEEAHRYLKQYFLVVKNKKTEQYLEQVEFLVTVRDEIEARRLAKEEEERLRIAKENELKRIDSLKTIWTNKARKLGVNADSIYAFNKKGYALFSKDTYFGIVNDKAEVEAVADEYKAGISFEGFILLLDKKVTPTKIFYFDTSTGKGALMPSPNDFNTLSTNYGYVSLPRENGRLVTYPNNSFKPMVYDLKQHKIVKIGNLEEVLRDLKKNDRIRKYNKDDEVKIDKDWYKFGGHLGGGIHPLYLENDYKVFAYLCAIDGKVLYTATNFDYIGAFHGNKYQAIKAGKVSWINQNGTKVSKAKDAFKDYKGSSKILKLEEGVFQVLKEGKFVKGNETLEKLPDFLNIIKK
ncbi:hypothetical protein [Polaribacter tangerinus]|uniref:hypothetical protein n=1 Tax=Polaribacter tangerinus TaxID=1920034 RepID=UPI000B4ADBF0|nr:hypothetical protein [Polaribacter tangerinus]